MIIPITVVSLVLVAVLLPLLALIIQRRGKMPIVEAIKVEPMQHDCPHCGSAYYSGSGRLGCHNESRF